jgi:general secretion pathway protein G
MWMNERRQHRSGFTLVEVLLVIVIIGILAGIAVPQLMKSRDKADIGKAKAEIKNLSTAVDMYKIDTGLYPNSLDGLNNNPGVRDWDGPYMKKMPEGDPWGKPYVYSSTGDGYEIRSEGPPGKSKPISSND